jgi:multidrug resistance efflux pump
MVRGKWLLGAGTVILVGIGAGALSLLRRSAAPAQPGGAPPPAPVFGPEISLLGKVQARNVVLIGAPTEGTVEEFPVQVGQDVFEGQLLARIRNVTLETAVELAQAELDKAQSRVANLEANLIAAHLEASRAEADRNRARAEAEKAEKVFLRQQLLYKEGATPRLVFERAQKEHLALQSEHESLAELATHAAERVDVLVREIDAARRTLEEKNEEFDLAKEHLQAAEIHSPVDGILIARRGDAGIEVDPSIKDLFQIAVELASLEVLLEPEPPALARIRAGQPAAVRLAELGNEPIPGSVREVKGNQVLVEFTSPSPAIRPGLTAQVTIRIG